ncbi:hypothetical protein BMS3Bbin02_00891 [bacterium BMS3Bbin02]|nr:hypothetical protein BMS3Bbin02_00891 [bacterium BMS3Bbin02]
MGQTIEIGSVRVVGDVASFTTDRNVSSQDGGQFSGAEEASASTTYPGLLATRLFGAIDGLDHVFAASNQIVIRRPGGWDDEATAAASSEIETFFRFYTDEA